MKKYLLFLSCSLFAASSVQAMNAKEQLAAMKELFVKEFEKIDTNKNGVLDKEEYLSFQFENFRTNIIEANGFDSPSPKEVLPSAIKTSASAEKSDSKDLEEVPPALREMADYDLDFDELLVETEQTNTLDAKDFIPKEDTDEKKSGEDSDSFADIPELDLTLSEDESLNNIIEDMKKKENPAQEKAAPKKDTEAVKKRISTLLENIKETLPKKIDEITTWTDITYEDNTIFYVYQADVDISSFSDKEMSALKNSIENEACVNVYYEMCPKIKPAFIDEGINVEILYQDKNGTKIDSCKFNDTTCG